MLAVAGGIILVVLLLIFLDKVIQAALTIVAIIIVGLIVINFPKTIATIAAIGVFIWVIISAVAAYRQHGRKKLAKLALLVLVLIAITSTGGYCFYYLLIEYGSSGWAIAAFLATLIFDAILCSRLILNSEAKPNNDTVPVGVSQSEATTEEHSGQVNVIRSFEGWSREEDKALLDALAARAELEQIANNHGRTISAIKARLRKINRINS